MPSYRSRYMPLHDHSRPCFLQGGGGGGGAFSVKARQGNYFLEISKERGDIDIPPPPNFTHGVL